MRLAFMGCRQANREGPRVTQGLLPYSRKHGARVARLRWAILRDSKGIVTFGTITENLKSAAAHNQSTGTSSIVLPATLTSTSLTLIS